MLERCRGGRIERCGRGGREGWEGGIEGEDDVVGRGEGKVAAWEFWRRLEGRGFGWWNVLLVLLLPECAGLVEELVWRVGKMGGAGDGMEKGNGNGE